MKFDILNRFSGEVQISAEIDCAADTIPSVKLGLAVKWAIKEKKDLYGANLRSADLYGANLRSANLRSADLYGANLRSADLYGANLRSANLRSADLYGANLRSADLYGADLRIANLRSADLYGADLYGADLYGADLRSADLYGANLRSADLYGADLYGADLYGADLRSADLRSFKADMWMTLTQNRSEVEGLVKALQEGRVDGSQYEGECACLVGTIANIKGGSYVNLDHDSSNPSEQWFMMIRKGDKPGDESGGGFAAKMALEWALEWCAFNGIEIAAVEPTPTEI